MCSLYSSRSIKSRLAQIHRNSLICCFCFDESVHESFVLFFSFSFFSIFKTFRKFELIEPQLSVLARFCVYCIISSLAKIDEDKEDEQNQTKKLKRSFNENETSKDDERPSKKPKVDDSLLEILSDGTEKMETTSNRDGDVNVQSSSSTSTKSPTKSPSSKSSSKKQSTAEIPEPLNGCLQNLFKTLYKLTFSSDLTPKVLFVRQFLIYLHRCGGESILPVLNIFPSDLMKNLLKIPNDSTFNYDFVLR